MLFQIHIYFWVVFFIFLIAASLNDTLWDEQDNFFYDCLHTSTQSIPMKVRSVVGLTVLFNVAIIKTEDLKRLPDFAKRMNFIKHNRKSQNRFLPIEQNDKNGDILITLVHQERLLKILEKVMDENEFLSPCGIRALSKFHQNNPLYLSFNHTNYSINYQPAESNNNMFGGNSNWRGPVWLPVNFLLIQAMYQYHDFYKNSVSENILVNNQYHNFKEIADELSKRNISIFTQNQQVIRPVMQKEDWFYSRAENKELVLFYEYYNGDNGAGLGASHQTGWSSLVINLINKLYPLQKESES